MSEELPPTTTRCAAAPPTPQGAAMPDAEGRGVLRSAPSASPPSLPPPTPDDPDLEDVGDEPAPVSVSHADGAIPRRATCRMRSCPSIDAAHPPSRPIVSTCRFRNASPCPTTKKGTLHTQDAAPRALEHEPV